MYLRKSLTLKKKEQNIRDVSFAIAEIFRCCDGLILGCAVVWFLTPHTVNFYQVGGGEAGRCAEDEQLMDRLLYHLSPGSHGPEGLCQELGHYLQSWLHEKEMVPSGATQALLFSFSHYLYISHVSILCNYFVIHILLESDWIKSHFYSSNRSSFWRVFKLLGGNSWYYLFYLFLFLVKLDRVPWMWV